MSVQFRRLLAAAGSAAGRGWPVFPLQPYGKRPAIRDWPHRATRDHEQLTAWWTLAPYNPLTGLPRDPPRQMAATVPITRRTSASCS